METEAAGTDVTERPAEDAYRGRRIRLPGGARRILAALIGMSGSFDRAEEACRASRPL
jgi:hypothetical protein